MAQIFPGVQRPYEYNVRVVQGDIPDHFPFSINGTVITDHTTYMLCAQNENVASLPYGYITTAQTVTVSSSSGNDASGGTGCNAVLVTGIDENWALIEEVVLLNGQTPVSTVAKWHRAFELTGLSYGTNIDSIGDSAAVGTVYLGYGTVTNGIPRYALTALTGSDPNSRTCMFTVPDGYNLVLSNMDVFNDVATNGDVFTTVYMAARPYGFKQWFKSPEFHCIGHINVVFKVPFFFPPRTDIEVRTRNNNAQTQKTTVNMYAELIKI